MHKQNINAYGCPGEETIFVFSASAAAVGGETADHIRSCSRCLRALDSIREFDGLLRHAASGSTVACPDAGVLAAWMEGNLDLAESEAVRAHAEACTACSSVISAFADHSLVQTGVASPSPEALRRVLSLPAGTAPAPAPARNRTAAALRTLAIPAAAAAAGLIAAIVLLALATARPGSPRGAAPIGDFQPATAGNHGQAEASSSSALPPRPSAPEPVETVESPAAPPVENQGGGQDEAKPVEGPAVGSHEPGSK